MSQDVRLKKDDDNTYDLYEDENGDLATAEGLETSIMVSLFTNSRCPSENAIDSFNRQGWVGNLIDPVQDYELGSNLFLLNQSREIIADANRARDWILNCIQWMNDDGVTDRIVVNVFSESNYKFRAEIYLYKDNNSVGQFRTVWALTDILE